MYTRRNNDCCKRFFLRCFWSRSMSLLWHARENLGSSLHVSTDIQTNWTISGKKEHSKNECEAFLIFLQWFQSKSISKLADTKNFYACHAVGAPRENYFEFCKSFLTFFASMPDQHAGQVLSKSNKFTYPITDCNRFKQRQFTLKQISSFSP